MGEVGDYWREHREYKRRQPRSEPASSGGGGGGGKLPERLTKAWVKLGFRACSSWHWQAQHHGKPLDYWPTAHKWRWNGTTMLGDSAKLIAWMKEPQP